jgi:sugar lactone lactonase YvrE
MLETVSLHARSGALASLLAALLPTGCSGVSPSVAPHPAATASAPRAGRPVAATLRVTVPAPSTAALARARVPKYVSPATKAIAISFTSTTVSNATPQSFNQNLTAGSAGCTGGLTTALVCNLSFALPPDTYTASATTYDQVLNGTTPQGNVLSSNQSFSVTLQPGVANVVSVILGGVPNGALLVPAPSASLTGGPVGFSMVTNTGAQKAIVAAIDADDNIILGPGAPTITLATSDPTFTAAIVDATLNPNEFALTAAGTNPGTTVTLTATITPATGGGAFAPVAFPIAVSGPPGVATLAGSTTGIGGFQDGLGTAAALQGPRQLATTPSGNLVVADNSNNAYRQVTPGGIVTTIAAASSVNGARFVVPSFTNVSGVAVDAAGDIFASQVNSGVITELAANGIVSTFATIAGANINALAIDASGTIYAPDAGAGGLYTISATGTVTQIVPNLTFTAPVGIAVDSVNGYVYIGDTINKRIARVPTVGGSVTTFVGTGVAGSADGPTGTATCGSVDGMAIANGTLYFADSSNNLIRKTVLSGANAGVTTTIAGRNGTGNTDSATIANGTFNTPFGIVAIPGDALYVTDNAGQNIRTIRGAF